MTPSAATRRAAVEAAALLGAVGIALAAAHRWHGAFDAALAPINGPLTELDLWLVVIGNGLICAILIARGPANWLERTLLRFMLAKFVIWAWFRWDGLGRSETAWTVVLTFVALTTIEFIARAAWRLLFAPVTDPPASADCWHLLAEHEAEIDRLATENARLRGEAA